MAPLGTPLAIFLALMVGGCNALIYHPGSTLPHPRATAAPDMAVVSYRTTDGLTLRSWHAPASGGHPTIVLFHGNAGTIASRAAKARLFLDAGYGVLLAEYRGYGGNPGTPTEDGLFADGRAALAFLAGRRVDPSRTVLYGESLGSGVAVRMAYEWAAKGHSVAAVVLEAPFLSVVSVAKHHTPWAPVDWLLSDRYDSRARIAGLGAPLLIVHGEQDTTVPVGQGRALFEQALEPKAIRLFPRASHNDLYHHGAGKVVLEYLESFRKR